jgi:hypothetical protein
VNLIIETAEEGGTVDIKVLVQFKGKGNSVYQGDFMGTFKRLPQERLDELMDPDENYRNSEVLDEVLVSVSGIGSTAGELTPDEQLAWVKRTPECVGAAVTAFFKELRPARYVEKTSKQRRGRG